MTIRHLISLNDLQTADILHLAHRALRIKEGKGGEPLKNKTVGIYFCKTSTRTRTSFSVAACRLGGHIVAYGPADLQTNTGESLADTAAVLSSYLDALVVRTAGPVQEIRTLAAQSSMAVVNAMSACEHPTQAISDLATLLEHFGSLEGLHVVYVGEGNNTATALARAMSRVPRMRLSLFTPEGYGIPGDVLEQAKWLAVASGATVEESHDVADLPANADAVYATRWQTTGTTRTDLNWRQTFLPFMVTSDLMARVGRRDGTVFLHDLPAVRGEDVESAVIDGPQSIAFRQAANKLFTAMAILEWCITPVRVEWHSGVDAGIMSQVL